MSPFDVASLEAELEGYKKQMEAPDFWDDVDEANTRTKKSKPVEAKLSAYHKLKQAA